MSLLKRCLAIAFWGCVGVFAVTWINVHFFDGSICSSKDPSQHTKYVARRAFAASPNVSDTSAPCAIRKGAFEGTSSGRSGDARQNAPEADALPAPGSPAAGTTHSLGLALVESESCEKPKLHWQLLPRHGCTVKEMVCVDQGRLIVFGDERVVPGSNFAEGQPFFETFAFHNIPGYADNLKGTKTVTFPMLVRVNSSADPPDIRDPFFQQCSIPLIWWPWWPMNPSDFFLQSVLPLERMFREGVSDKGIRYVPMLDGLQQPRYFQWWLSPFTRHKVEALEEVSARTNVGRRCFQRMVLCNLWHFWHWPPGRHWLDGLRPNSVAQQIVEHHLEEEHSLQVPLVGKGESLKVAFIERKGLRKILNLDEVMRQCNGLPLGHGRRADCDLVSFDADQDFPDVVRLLQDMDVLIGMHGAGLVNAFFMRPGAALIEIFPCRFGDEHQRNYFWHPSHAEMQTFAFQIFVTDEASCKPSELQKHPEGLNFAQGVQFIHATLARDQDIVLSFELVATALERAAEAQNGTLAAYRMRLAESPEFFVVHQGYSLTLQPH